MTTRPAGTEGGGGASPPVSRTPSTSDLVAEDDPLREAVLAQYENLQDTLAEAPILKGCEDEPSLIGSHGLPLLNLTAPSSSALKDSPGSPPPSIGVPLLPTPPISPVRVSVTDSDDEESPVGDITTPLKFDSSELTWRKTSESESAERLTPPRIIPTIDYLQVPPHHRAKLRRRGRVSFNSNRCDPSLVPGGSQLPSTISSVQENEITVCPSPSPSSLPHSSTSTTTTTPVPLETDIEVDPSQVVNGGVQETALVGDDDNSDTVGSLSAANCVIRIPRKQRRPSFSNINIPCYRRRPSGQALDVNFDYTFTVVG